MSEIKSRRSLILQGVVGSPGACLAKSYVFRKRIEVKRREISEEQIEGEVDRLDAAIKVTASDIQEFRRKAEQRHGEKYAEIFDSHLLMLEDPSFKPKMIASLKKQRVNIESIVKETIDKLQAAFMAIEDLYLRERAIDIKDVGERLLRHLMGLQRPTESIGNEPYILVAQEVTPSEILDFAKGKLQGVCLDTGGATSHVAILAGALGIPSVFGLGNFSLRARTDDMVMLDTRKECHLILCPSKDEIECFNNSLRDDIQTRELSDTTADGYKLRIAANIARAEELPLLEKLNITRVGLFRSEFIFMESMDLPSEKIQTEIYTKVVESAPDMAVLRSIDIGSDKPLRYVPLAHEENPAIGFRSVRFSLSRPDILEPQLRAMINAAQGGNCRIIFPMVSVPSELEAISTIYNRIVQEVRPEKVPEWGIMLEVPSAIFMMEEIARHTRYISLGTNDLFQFFFALDRTNEKIAELADYFYLPFLRLINQCVTAAKQLDITVAVCGEMAADPVGLVALLGMGIEDFSIRPVAIERALSVIPQVSYSKAQSCMARLLSNGCENNIRSALKKEFPILTEI